ncbi:hypothetical protein [Synergistes jonesii]
MMCPLDCPHLLIGGYDRYICTRFNWGFTGEIPEKFLECEKEEKENDKRR